MVVTYFRSGLNVAAGTHAQALLAIGSYSKKVGRNARQSLLKENRPSLYGQDLREYAGVS
jgi:hypothetical protein